MLHSRFLKKTSIIDLFCRAPMGIFLYFHILLVSCVPKDWSEKALDPIEIRYENAERSQYLRKYMRERFNDSIRLLVVNYSWKALHLRCLQKSWLRPKSLLANILSYTVHTLTEYKNIHTRYPASFHILYITKLLHIILLTF